MPKYYQIIKKKLVKKNVNNKDNSNIGKPASKQKVPVKIE